MMQCKFRLAAACLTLAAIHITGCSAVAEHAAPLKHAASSRGAAALRADDLFWSTLHAGDYDGIPAALEATTAAYLADPSDAVTAAHVGWLHIWRLAERARLAGAPATITDHAVLSRRYFQEAVALDPSEARYLGFLASATLAEASIHHDERLTRRGFFLLKDAIRAWPEFNLFTAGYVMSAQPPGSPRFRQALDWQWRNLDVCIGGRIDRRHPDYAAYMALETHTGPGRACWNSSIAPHNVEGFFLNMGDMLVKAGDVETARTIYANARLSPTYTGWPYRQVLEDRIRDAGGNVARFSAPSRDAPIMFNSTFACMACHQG